jgi:hypothetical protein
MMIEKASTCAVPEPALCCAWRTAPNAALLMLKAPPLHVPEFVTTAAVSAHQPSVSVPSPQISVALP